MIKCAYIYRNALKAVFDCTTEQLDAFLRSEMSEDIGTLTQAVTENGEALCIEALLEYAYKYKMWDLFDYDEEIFDHVNLTRIDPWDDCKRQVIWDKYAEEKYGEDKLKELAAYMTMKYE